MKIIKYIFTTIFCLSIFIASWALLFVFLFGTKFISLSLIGNKEIYMNIDNGYFENGYKCKFLAFDLTKNVTVNNKVNINSTGEYFVNYRINYLFYNKEIKRKVHVVDNEAPLLSLTGDTTVYVAQYSKYKEPGYKAIDSHDGDITKKVNITSNVDTQNLGTYTVKYEVSDAAGNTASAERNVEVIRSGMLNQPIEKFWLKGLYSDVIVEPSTTEYDYLEDAVLVGDSNIKYLYTHGKYLQAKQVWAKNNLNIVEINTDNKVTVYKNSLELTVDEALTKYQPKYLIVSFGLSSSFLTKDTFINNAEKFINDVLNNHPQTKLFIMSIPPIYPGTAADDAQAKINKTNYYALELCSKYKIGFINIADELRGADGYGKTEYLQCNNEKDCGFHLSNSAKKKLVDYMKRLDLEKEI